MDPVLQLLEWDKREAAHSCFPLASLLQQATGTISSVLRLLWRTLPGQRLVGTKRMQPYLWRGDHEPNPCHRIYWQAVPSSDSDHPLQHCLQLSKELPAEYMVSMVSLQQDLWRWHQDPDNSATGSSY